MNGKSIAGLILFCIVSSGCGPDTASKERPNLEIRDLVPFEQQNKVHDKIRDDREKSLAEYFSFKEGSKYLGWEPISLSRNDPDVLSCLPELKSNFQAHYSDIRFNTNLIKAARLENGLKIGLLKTSATTPYGQKTGAHTIVRLDTCKNIGSSPTHESVFISPHSGEVAKSNISPPRGDKNLLFLKFNNHVPFEVFVNSQKNGIAILEKPNLTEAIFVESEADEGCLFAVLNKGETAAQTISLSELCPSSRQLLQSTSIEYGLRYLWFGRADIAAHIAKSPDDLWGTEFLVPVKEIDDMSAEYLYQLRLGVRQTPKSDEIDLKTTGYVWSPFKWHKDAWQKKP